MYNIVENKVRLEDNDWDPFFLSYNYNKVNSGKGNDQFQP